MKEVEDPTGFGIANVQGEKIVKLVEKPKNPESNLAMAGMYFFGPQLWQVLPDLKPSGRGEYEITDAIQSLIDRGETVLAGLFEGVWFDTGTLDSYLKTSAFLIDDGALIDPSATVHGVIGAKVVIGAGAHVDCDLVEDSVVLPGASVKVSGIIRHAILAGSVSSERDVESEILHGDYMD